MESRASRNPVSEWWWTIDRGLLAALMLLLGLGMIVSFAASPAVAERIGLDPFHFTERHALFAVVSVAVMIAVSYLPARIVRRLALFVLLGSLAAMVLTLAIGTEVKGSRRWISVLGFSLQPSEFMKPAFVIICAWLFAQGGKGREIPGNLFASVLMVLVAVLLLAQPDLGQTVLTLAVWGMMFFVGGMPWLWVIGLGLLATGGIAGAYLLLPHVAGRINRFITGEGDNYQVETATEAIVAGGWLGKGPGEGTVKAVLPDSHTDFVFAVVAEEFGIVMTVAIVLVFAFIVMKGFVRCLNEHDAFTRLAVAGLVMLFGFQALINMGVNLRLLPAKGMTLPFISSGGSSLLSVAIGMGMLLALTRTRPDHRAKRFALDDGPRALSFDGAGAAR